MRTLQLRARARGDAYLRDVVRNYTYVRPVTWLDATADKGPKFVDHAYGGRYSIFLQLQLRIRRLRVSSSP